jgi:hypothetical protein
MRRISWRVTGALVVTLGFCVPHLAGQGRGGSKASGGQPPGGTKSEKTLKPSFQTSDRCLACHNGLTAPSGKDVSIGFDWRSTIMANSSRDPYWQASVRREGIDHPESKAAIEDVCSTCHMPMMRYEAKAGGKLGEVFGHLPFGDNAKKNASAEDGVSCGVCHQISPEKLGTKESFTGGFVVEAPTSKDNHPEYGPFVIEAGQARIMQTSTEGFRPTTGTHIQTSEFCATCHTLYTKALFEGKEVGTFPEQVPFLEWKHSDYAEKQTCQSCHMPEVREDAPITTALGVLRHGVREHTFVGANFFMLNVLNIHRGDLSVQAMPQELTAEAERTKQFLQKQSARVTIRSLEADGGRIQTEVLVENLTGHKLPTAYPSRRAWLHFVLRDRNGKTVFESGALHPDGSIEGNDNDADPLKFEPHYREITKSDEVQIYEPILKDYSGKVTTGLSNAAGYLKDNRLLPTGFEKATAEHDIAVTGDAADDPNFTAAGDVVRYAVGLGDAQGPFQVEAELWYQPIGFRWAHNLAPYDSMETKRWVGYYEQNAAQTAIVLARATATR